MGTKASRNSSVSVCASLDASSNGSVPALSAADTRKCVLCSNQSQGQWIALRRCDHVFHRDCLDNHRLTSNLCPVCKTVISYKTELLRLVGVDIETAPTAQGLDYAALTNTCKRIIRASRDEPVSVKINNAVRITTIGPDTLIHESPLQDLVQVVHVSVSHLAFVFTSEPRIQPQRSPSLGRSYEFTVVLFRAASKAEVIHCFKGISQLCRDHRAWWCMLSSWGNSKVFFEEE
jgi:hypothetical protein